MTYISIKKILFVVFLGMMISKSVFAQNNLEGMRLLTVNALISYGQKLYERGDFPQAGAVFNRVLSYQSNQPKAIEFLTKMGCYTAKKPRISQKFIHAQPIKMVININSSKKQEQYLEVFDNEALYKAIKAKKEHIRVLKSQIAQLRQTLALTFAGH